MFLIVKRQFKLMVLLLAMFTWIAFNKNIYHFSYKQTIKELSYFLGNYVLLGQHFAWLNKVTEIVFFILVPHCQFILNFSTIC